MRWLLTILGPGCRHLLVGLALLLVLVNGRLHAAQTCHAQDAAASGQVIPDAPGQADGDDHQDCHQCHCSMPAVVPPVLVFIPAEPVGSSRPDRGRSLPEPVSIPPDPPPVLS